MNRDLNSLVASRLRRCNRLAHHEPIELSCRTRVGAPVAGGASLAVYGSRIFALLDEALAEARVAAAPDAGRVRLAAVTTAAEQLLPELLGGFRRAAPRIDVELEVANKDQVGEPLARWECDLVLAGRPPQGSHSRSHAIRPNDVVIVAQPGRTYGPDGLASATWPLREAGSGTRDTTEFIFSELGIKPPALTIGSNGAIRVRVVHANAHLLLAQTFEAELRFRVSLGEAAARLKPHGFLRVHRSYLVNPEHVVEVTPFFGGSYVLRLDDKARTEVSVSRGSFPVVKRAFGP